MILIESITKKNPEDDRDDQLEQLQTEMETMKIQMIGQMVGQMALIQNFAQGQEELRTLVNKLHQDRCNRMKQIVEAGDQVINQPPKRQEVGLVESGPFQIAATSRAQQQPRQPRQGGWRQQGRQFVEIDIPLAQALHHMLEAKLITLREPPKKPNTSASHLQTQ